MAGGQERILKRRIATVQSTKKITRAMELIAASRIVKAQQAVQAAVPYSDHITEVVRDLGAAGGASGSPLLTPRPEIRKVAHVVVTADRGLCGAYNSSVIRAAEGSMKEQADLGRDYALFLVGRKAEGYFRYRNFRIDESFTGFSDRPTYEDARKIGRTVTKAFEAELLDAFRTRHADLMGQIRDSGALPDEAVLRQAVDDVKAAFVARTASEAAAVAADVTATDAEALGEAASAKTLDTE